MTEALEIIVKATGEAVGFACSSCLQYVPGGRSPGADATARAKADACCVPKFCACGATLVSCDYGTCHPCHWKAREAMLAEAEARAFAEAKRIREHDHEGPVFWPRPPKGVHGDLTWDGDDGAGFSDVASLRSYCIDERIELPREVYACGTSTLTLDASEILDAAIESQEFFEDAVDNVHEKHHTLLQTYLDTWCELVDLKSYRQLDEVVVLDPPDPPNAGAMEAPS